jgi:hypothetical protein
MRARAVLGIALGLVAFAPAARAQDAARYTIAESCDQRFVELAPKREPESMVWGRFGDPIDTYYGVVAYSNGQASEPRRRDRSGRYQCTELVHRYLSQVFGVPSKIGMGLGNGVDLARGVATHWGRRTWSGGIARDLRVRPRYFANGKTRCRPTVGSIVSVDMRFGSGERGAGHVAILRTLDAKGDDAYEAVLFEQHGSGAHAPEHVLQPSRVRFTRDAKGFFRGVHVLPNGREDSVEGWTNFAVER